MSEPRVKLVDGRQGGLRAGGRRAVWRGGDAPRRGGTVRGMVRGLAWVHGGGRGGQVRTAGSNSLLGRRRREERGHRDVKYNGGRPCTQTRIFVLAQPI